MVQTRQYDVETCVAFDLEAGESLLSPVAPCNMAIQGEQIGCGLGLLEALARPQSTAGQIAALRANGSDVAQAVAGVPLRPDWGAVRFAAARAVLAGRTEQDEAVRETLLATGDVPLVAVGNDPVWGAVADGQGHYVGPNAWGRLWMGERDRLQRGEPFVPDGRLALLGQPLDLAQAGVPTARMVIAGSRDMEGGQMVGAGAFLRGAMAGAMQQTPGICFEMGDNPLGVDALALNLAEELNANYRVWYAGEPRVHLNPEKQGRLVEVTEAERLSGAAKYGKRDQVMVEQAECGIFLSNGQLQYRNRPTGTVAGYDTMTRMGGEAALIGFEVGTGEARLIKGEMPEVIGWNREGLQGADDALTL